MSAPISTDDPGDARKSQPEGSHPPSPPSTLAGSRRDFLKTATAGAAGAALSAGLPGALYGRPIGRATEEPIRVGIIGVGRVGRGHLRLLREHPQAQVVALCDVYQPNLDFAAERAPEADTYTDFRRVIDRQDVDAVFVATPDHWHALPTIRACEAGKDVYVEKPASHTVREGRRMVEAARQHKRVVQVGTQQRSAPHFQQVVEIVREGRLGPISFVRSWNYENQYPDGIGDPPDSAPPPGLDWDMWLGPAPKVPFNPNRFGVYLNEDLSYKDWAYFRWFWDYAGGQMTDWGVHLLDIVRWAMDVEAPDVVSAVGGKFYLQDNSTTPDTMTATYRYPSFVCHYEYRMCSGPALHEPGYGISFHGTEGTLFVNRGGFMLTPNQDSDLEAMEVEREGDSHLRHVQNFFDCIRTRERPISDIEVGHRSSSMAILGNVALRTGRRLQWEAESERIMDDAEASALLSKEYRDPWTL